MEQKREGERRHFKVAFLTSNSFPQLRQFSFTLAAKLRHLREQNFARRRARDALTTNEFPQFTQITPADLAAREQSQQQYFGGRRSNRERFTENVVAHA
jgi:hypothetical protein